MKTPKLGWIAPILLILLIVFAWEREVFTATPLPRENNLWHVDTAHGRKEMLFHRIRKNEFNTLQVMMDYAAAQLEYSEMAGHKTGQPIYAQRFLSRVGTKDGLYWPTRGEEPESPSGFFVAQAAVEGHDFKARRDAYHGYHYRILTKQGPSARGGRLDYVVQGKMTGGFGLVAWPAVYQETGVMTFITNHEGVIYQKDLGYGSGQRALHILEFDPDASWQAVALPTAAP
jgi:hypothetical protein